MRSGRHVLLLFLALVLALGAPLSVAADPDEQTIIQALDETAREWGYGGTVEKGVGSYDNLTYWRIRAEANGESFWVKDYGSAGQAQAKFAEYDPISHGGYQLDFHGYPAVRHPYAPFFVDILIGQFIFHLSWAEHSEMQIPEIFYRHAVQSGFMVNDGSVKGPASEPAVATPDPEITPTPAPGAPITLHASAEGYGEATEVIDNSAHFSSVAISGRVTDLITGAGIGGATVTIIAGAESRSTLSTADGSYSLTALAPGGADSGQIGGVDLALAPQADLTIEVVPERTELLADGLSTASVIIHVQDLQGNPIQGREFHLDASADAGPGAIQPTLAATDANGIIQATYTAFRPTPDLELSDKRTEVTLTARDTATGLTGSAALYVSQYQLAIVHDAYIPACRQCDFPAKLTVMVTDAWFQPVPDAPLTFEILGMGSDAILVQDPTAAVNQQELSLTTDGNGQATVYLKWQGNLDITEVVQQVVVYDRTTHARETVDVRVHGLDIAIARVQEAGFTGVTGQEAFFKVYFKERIHPELSLDRFNVAQPNRLKLRVTISQYHSEGSGVSYGYESDGGWDRDGLGTYIKMFATPHMPHIIPVNDGTSWYEIRVDAVLDENVYLFDLNRANNDTILALTTGSPDGWLHIWLTEGVLTPRSYAGVLVKCVARFLPGLGDAITVIDTLNQVYSSDVLGLGQSTAQVLTEALQQKATSPSMLTQLKASALNNVVSCMQDSYGVYRAAGGTSSLQTDDACTGTASLASTSPGALMATDYGASLPGHGGDQLAPGPAPHSPNEYAITLVGFAAPDALPRIYSDSDQGGETQGGALFTRGASASSAAPYAPSDEALDSELFDHAIDQFIHGFLLDSPDQRAVAVFGLAATDVAMLDDQGKRVDVDRMSASGNATIYLLPAQDRYTLQIAAASAFDIAVYQAGGNDELRQTRRHTWQPGGPVSASMLVGGDSDYGLTIDENGDGAPEHIMQAKAIAHDVARPSITSLEPAPGATVFARGVTIGGEFADNPGGSGIDPAAVHVLVDGKDQTTVAIVTADRLALQVNDLAAGEHSVMVEIRDRDGNMARAEWGFIAQSGLAGLLSSPLLLPVAAGGAGLLLLMLAILALAPSRRRRTGQQAPAPLSAAPDIWWLARGAQRYGPYSWAQLVAVGREGRIQPNDLVYDPRAGEWRVAKGYPGLVGRR